MEYDVVNKPRHYNQGGIECIDALKAATVSKTGIEAVCTANAIKYLWRYEEKDGIEYRPFEPVRAKLDEDWTIDENIENIMLND